MKKLIFLLCMVMMCSTLIQSAHVFAANYQMEYKLYPVTEVNSTTAIVQGFITRGKQLDNNITIPGYVYSLYIWETSNPSTKKEIYINGAVGTSGGSINTFVDNLKPNTEYTITVRSQMNIIPAPGFPAELTFRTAPSENILKGDINRDGKVNSLDYNILKDVILKKATLDDEDARLAADVSGDGKIKANDVTLLRRLILGLIS